MMERPLVSVICLCYNQERFVEEAIRSVINQTYRNVELIVIDDASTDNSINVIKSVLNEFQDVQLVAFPENVGNCKAFNKGLLLTRGSIIIDLAGDDILLPNRIERGVQILTEKGKSFGVHFSDAEIIDEYGTFLHKHSDRFLHQAIPQGDVYVDVIRKYFICPPTVMFTRSVMDVLGGYDETLSYEDFDFWIRSSRTFQYIYSPEVLVKRRISKNALGSKQFKLFNKHSKSTYTVCEKIFRLNNTREEQQALQQRILYEIKLNARLLNIGIVIKFFILLLRNSRKKY